MRKPLYLLALGILLLAAQLETLQAQQVPTTETPTTTYKDLKTRLWVNTYGNIRISKRLFWIAQTHFRFEETENTPFIGQIGQIYNRHAIGYIYDKSFYAALGGVLRMNFNTTEGDQGRRSVPEWRIWHEYQFAMPVSSVMIYHRLRIEHRWSQGFAENSEYIFRNRWRYMFRAKIPINNNKFEPGTFYVSPEAELIMQSGKAVVDSPLEDLRLHTSFGYVITPRLTAAAGLMYSFGQQLEDGGIYKQSFTPRLHLYFSPDFRKVRNKLPEIHFND